MTADELRERIRLGEDFRTEFKTRAHPDDLAAEMVAFANSGGGLLLLGVADDRSVTGVEDSDREMQRIDNVARQNIEPPLPNIGVETFSLDNRVVLAVSIPKGPQRPYRTNRGVHYVRATASRRQVTRQELLEMFQSAGSFSPDEMPVEAADMAVLDKDYLLEARPELRNLSGEEESRALRNMKIMSADGRPTVGGLVCFGRETELRPYFRITAIRLPGVEAGEDFLDRRELAGPLHRQIAGAQAFLREHLRAADKGPEPLYSFPMQALDEAVVNAAAHRDYLATSQIRLFVFDDRVEIVNPGRLLNSVTLDTLRSGLHVVRNPVVFSHLARIRLATEAGLGIPNMLRLMRASRLPEPEFSAASGEIRVTFRRGP